MLTETLTAWEKHFKINLLMWN